LPYQIIVEDEGLVFRFHGVVEFIEIMKANREWYCRTDLDQYRYHIWDFGNVDRLYMDEHDTRIVAEMDSMPFRLINKTKLALIGHGNDLKNIFMKYVLALKTEKIDAQVFDDESEARKWIGI
tara:strand:+ start:211 stop:579 length:369 start_codon:yes stop_codon:yes gene_type:complete